jgi:epoxyqueuosine reductase
MHLPQMLPPTPHAAAQAIKAWAAEVGFDLVGIARAEPSGQREAAAYRAWVESGKHGNMEYLARNLDERADIRKKFPWAKSILCVAIAYHQEPPGIAVEEPAGKIARYAWGRDYHKVIEYKLRKLEQRMRAAFEVHGEPLEIRTYADTGPLPEREFAARAGLGWIGKNTLLLHPRHGSYFLLGELITNLELEPDSPMDIHCGTCTRCIQACPTDAIAPWSVDARRCISYHTLEHRPPSPIDEAYHPAIREAGYIVGCDICQEVCPFNRRPLPTREPDFAPRSPAPAISLQQVLAWQEQDWDIATRGRAHRRAKFEMWQRNSRLLLGLPQEPSLAATPPAPAAASPSNPPTDVPA